VLTEFMFHTSVTSRIATIIPNRPVCKNPLTLESCAELRDTLRYLVYCSAITNIVITGIGDMPCCATRRACGRRISL